MDNHGLVSTNPAIVYVMVKHNAPNTPVTIGGSIRQQHLPSISITPNQPSAPPNTLYYPRQQPIVR